MTSKSLKSSVISHHEPLIGSKYSHPTSPKWTKEEKKEKERSQFSLPFTTQVAVSPSLPYFYGLINKSRNDHFIFIKQSLGVNCTKEILFPTSKFFGAIDISL